MKCAANIRNFFEKFAMHCKFPVFLVRICSALHFSFPAEGKIPTCRGKNSSLPRQEFFPPDEKKEGKVCENFIFSITFVAKSMNDGMSHEPNE